MYELFIDHDDNNNNFYGQSILIRFISYLTSANNIPTQHNTYVINKVYVNNEFKPLKIKQIKIYIIMPCKI